MPKRQDNTASKGDEKWLEGDAAVQDLQEVLKGQKDPRLQEVKVWLNRINPERGMMYVGIALGEGLGCSPFCGCAAKQIGDQFEPFLLNRIPWLSRVVMEPESPMETDSDSFVLKLV